MQLRTGAVAALLAVLLLGCGGDGEQEGDTETAAPAPQPVARVVSLSDA